MDCLPRTRNCQFYRVKWMCRKGHHTIRRCRRPEIMQEFDLDLLTMRRKMRQKTSMTVTNDMDLVRRPRSLEHTLHTTTMV